MSKHLPTHLDIVKSWLPRYTGMSLNQFGDYILLTNFKSYVSAFADQFACDVYGEDRPMQAATNNNGVTIINFGIGSPNAATMMDLLCACHPKVILFCQLRQSGAREPAMTTFHRKCLPCRPLNCINLCRKKYTNTVLNIAAVWFIPLTVEFGSMTSNFWIS